MTKFCPECGIKLEKDFNFCPECGYNLKDTSGTTDIIEDSIESVICENCGEENNPENIACAGCGIKLKDSGKAVNRPEANRVTKQPEKKHSGKVNKKSKQKNSVRSTSVQETPKALSTNNFIVILGSAVVVILIIMYAAGVFDKPVVPLNNVTQNSVPGSGIDLSNLQRINALEARVKANPGDKESLVALAHLKNDSGLYEQAIINYKQYLQMNPGDADARVDMGVCYFNLQNYSEAIKEMEAALKYQPQHQIAFLNLGIVNLSAGNVEKSKEWLKKAIAVNPNNNIGSRANEILNSNTN